MKPSRTRRLIVAMLFVTVVINHIDRSSIAIAAPSIADDLKLSPVQMGLVFSAFAWPIRRCRSRVWLQTAFGWRGMFLVTGALGLFWAVGFRLLCPDWRFEPMQRRPRRSIRYSSPLQLAARVADEDHDRPMRASKSCFAFSTCDPISIAAEVASRRSIARIKCRWSSTTQ